MNYSWNWGVLFEQTGIGNELYLHWMVTGLGWRLLICSIACNGSGSVIRQVLVMWVVLHGRMRVRLVRPYLFEWLKKMIVVHEILYPVKAIHERQWCLTARIATETCMSH